MHRAAGSGDIHGEAHHRRPCPRSGRPLVGVNANPGSSLARAVVCLRLSQSRHRVSNGRIVAVETVVRGGRAGLSGLGGLR